MAGSRVRAEGEGRAFPGSEMGGGKGENPKPRHLLLGHQRASTRASQRRSGTASPFDPPFTSQLRGRWRASLPYAAVTPLPLRVSKLALPSLLVSHAH